MKKNSTHPSKRLVLNREVLANLVTGGSSHGNATFVCYRTLGNNCLTVTCGLNSCADCAAE